MSVRSYRSGACTTPIPSDDLSHVLAIITARIKSRLTPHPIGTVGARLHLIPPPESWSGAVKPCARARVIFRPILIQARLRAVSLPISQSPNKFLHPMGTRSDFQFIEQRCLAPALGSAIIAEILTREDFHTSQF